MRSLPANIAALDWTRWNRGNLAKIHGSIPMRFRERRKACIQPNVKQGRQQFYDISESKIFSPKISLFLFLLSFSFIFSNFKLRKRQIERISTKFQTRFDRKSRSTPSRNKIRPLRRKRELEGMTFGLEHVHSSTIDTLFSFHELVQPDRKHFV